MSRFGALLMTLVWLVFALMLGGFLHAVVPSVTWSTDWQLGYLLGIVVGGSMFVIVAGLATMVGLGQPIRAQEVRTK